MTPLLLIGCGNMGSALATRWKSMPEFSLSVVEPNGNPTVPHVKRLEDLPADFSPGIVVLAVKPQQLDGVMQEAAKKFGNKPTYISIAAGKNIAYYEQYVAQGAGVVRAMPNTPAMIGQGITALCANKAATTEGRNLAAKLMGAVGETLWLDESLMDAVTALSGSGPAYIYYIIECLAAAGEKHGLSKEDAVRLALKTCAGAAALAAQSGTTVETLRKQVTSPGGTTEAALAVFQKDNGLQKLIESAIDAAVTRAKEL